MEQMKLEVKQVHFSEEHETQMFICHLVVSLDVFFFKFYPKDTVMKNVYIIRAPGCCHTNFVNSVLQHFGSCIQRNFNPPPPIHTKENTTVKS